MIEFLSKRRQEKRSDRKSLLIKIIGATGGNRTRVYSLGSYRSTIELRLQIMDVITDIHYFIY